MNNSTPSGQIEQISANRVLIVAANHSSLSMQRFVQWILAGFGAGLAFLLANGADVQEYVDLSYIQKSAKWFIFAIFLGILHQYFATSVQAGCGAYEALEKSHKDSTSPINLARFFILLIEAHPPLVRWMTAWNARGIVKGDYTRAGRLIFNLCYLQSAIGFSIAVVLVWSLWEVLGNIK